MTLAAFVVLAALAAPAAPPAAAPKPPARVESIRDASGRVFASMATIDRAEGSARHQLVLFRRAGRDDLVVSSIRTGSGERTLTRVWAGRGAALLIERLADGRYSIEDGTRALRWYGEDAATRTVRCAVRTAADARGGSLVTGIEEYLTVKEALAGEKGADMDRPLVVFRREGPTANPLLRVPAPGEDAEAGELRRDAEAAFQQAVRAR